MIRVIRLSSRDSHSTPARLSGCAAPLPARGWRNTKPSASNRRGATRWPSTSKSACSPSKARITKAGVGMKQGRCSTLPATWAKSALAHRFRRAEVVRAASPRLLRCGAPGGRCRGSHRAHAPTTSTACRCPAGHPTPKRIGSSICGSEPWWPKTRPKRMQPTCTPYCSRLARGRFPFLHSCDMKIGLRRAVLRQFRLVALRLHAVVADGRRRQQHARLVLRAGDPRHQLLRQRRRGCGARPPCAPPSSARRRCARRPG